MLYRSTPDEVAQVWSAIEGFADRAFTQARTDGRRESFEAYAADGLLAMARGAAAGASSGGRPRATKVIVRIDHAALVRGRVGGDELCEIAGVGPVAVSAVRDLLASGDPFVAAVVTKGHHHHALKTRSNWQLVEGKGKRRIVPPGDPAHPEARAGPCARAG